MLIHRRTAGTKQNYNPRIQTILSIQRSHSRKNFLFLIGWLRCKGRRDTLEVLTVGNGLSDLKDAHSVGVLRAGPPAAEHNDRRANLEVVHGLTTLHGPDDAVAQIDLPWFGDGLRVEQGQTTTAQVELKARRKRMRTTRSEIQKRQPHIKIGSSNKSYENLSRAKICSFTA